MFTQLNFDVMGLIAEFAGTTQQWKMRFTEDVLPHIDRGWKTVGMYEPFPGMERVPCANCYMYGIEVNGDMGVCLNCDEDLANGTLVLDSLCFEDMQEHLALSRFERFCDFKKYRDVYNHSLVIITEELLETSSVFREVRMLGLV